MSGDTDKFVGSWTPKVGERVRYAGENPNLIGLAGAVESIRSCECVEVDFQREGTYIVAAKNLRPELLPVAWMPKVGDRVRFTGDAHAHPHMNGRLGPVLDVREDGRIVVDFGAGVGRFACGREDLEPAAGDEHGIAAIVVKGIGSALATKAIVFGDMAVARAYARTEGGLVIEADRIEHR